jgi:hypothetical protein
MRDSLANGAIHARAFRTWRNGLLCATLPVTWMPASMDYCYDDDLGLLDSKVNSEGKARH